MEDTFTESTSSIGYDTGAAFAEGLEYAGLYVTVVGASIIAIAAIILFYLYMKTRADRENRRKGIV